MIWVLIQNTSYLSALDELVKHKTERPSAGIILYKTKNNVLAEYTLRDMMKSMKRIEVDEGPYGEDYF